MPGAVMQHPLRRASDLHWSAQYVGLPWREDADGPDAYDCKALVRHVLPRHLGLPAPRIVGAGTPADWAAVRDSVQHDGWHRVQAPAMVGDIVVLHNLQGAHVGVVIAGGRLPRVLHAEGQSTLKGEPRGAVVVDELRDLLAGVYSRPQLWRYLG